MTDHDPSHLDLSTDDPAPGQAFTLAVMATTFTGIPCPAPPGEREGEMWLGRPIDWYEVDTGRRTLAARLSRVADPGGERSLWRIPLGARHVEGRRLSYVFARSLRDALLIMKNADDVELVDAVVREMTGAGRAATAHDDDGTPRSFRLVLDVEAHIGGETMVEVRENGVMLFAGRPWAGPDGRVRWEFPFRRAENGTGYEPTAFEGAVDPFPEAAPRLMSAPTVGTMLRAAANLCPARPVGADDLHRVIGAFDVLRKRLVDLNAAMTRGERRISGIERMPERVAAEMARLDRLIADIYDFDEGLAPHTVPGVEGRCESPHGVCPDHGVTLRLVDVLDRAGGKVTECAFPTCDNRWDRDRLGADCDQVATLLANEPEPRGTDPAAPLDAEQVPRSVRACQWHGDQLAAWGWSVRLIPAEDGETVDVLERYAAERELAERCRAYNRRRSGITQATADLGALGFRADELPLGTPSPMSPIEMRIHGGLATALAYWRFEAATGVFVFAEGRVPVEAGGVREVSTWVELIDALVVEPGPRARAAVLYLHLDGEPAEKALTRARQGGVDDGVTDRLTREIENLGFTTEVRAEGREHLVDVVGYGYRFAIRLRDDASLGRRIFAGAWQREGHDDPGHPVTWSTWLALHCKLNDIVRDAAGPRPDELGFAGPPSAG